MATPPKRWALDTVGEKVLRYETFISDALQRDLQKVLDHRDKVYEQLSVYLQLRHVIERLQETNHSELYMQVDLGCNFFVDTVVPDTSRIYVALGYVFFLELTLAEALKFIDRKSSLLTEPRQPHQGLHEYQGPYPHDARGESSSLHPSNIFRVIT
jgi:prefoldin subunit 5